MNLEQISQQQDPTILMQVPLIEKHPDWIDLHAEEFREYIILHPEIVELFKKNPEKAIKTLEEKYYPETLY